MVPGRAVAAPDNPYRDYYVWRDEPPPDSPKDVVFPDQEDSIWELRPARPAQYYLHHFYKHQPDLNIDQPRGPRRDRAGSWASGCELGRLGVPRRRRAVPARQDDVPGERDAVRPARLPRATCGRSSAGASATRVLLGEVNLPPQGAAKPSSAASDGDELHMQFDFIGMQSIYLSLARGDARPARQGAAQPARAARRTRQWANFVRNHDELTLDKLTDDGAAGGLRRLRARPGHAALRPRAAAPAADRCSTATRAGSGWSTACCSPCPARRCCSTARRSGWARTSTSRAGWPCARRCSGPPARNGGFSTAARRGCRGRWPRARSGPEHVNVADQRRDPDSLLDFIAAADPALPRSRPELGWADFTVLDQPHRHVLAHESPGTTVRIVAVHNLGPETVPCTLTLEGCDGSTTSSTYCSRPRTPRSTTQDGPRWRWTATATAGCGSALQTSKRLA